MISNYAECSERSAPSQNAHLCYSNRYNLRIIIAEIWENNSNKIKEWENRIIAKIWSIIISSLLPKELRVGLGGETPYTMAHPIWSQEELEGVEITHTPPKTWVDKVRGTFLHCKSGIS